jgi:hypothetical protein
MNQPRRFLVRMILFLAAVVSVASILYQQLWTAFLANAYLNGPILGVFLLGILYNFRQVIMLYPEVAWIEGFRKDHAVLSQQATPKLLAPMATMLGERKGRLSLSALSMRSLLDSIYSRLDESRDLSRYTIGLLIFLGLLGTFWGLLATVSSIRDVIGGLAVGGGDAANVFSDLLSGLEMPLDGMGTAFSSSLFGLAGSLVLGFLDLQAGQAQNRFYNDLEDWLSSLTRLSSGALSSDGDQPIPVYVQALLEQTAESLENLQRVLVRGEESRISANNHLMALSEKVGILTDHMRTEQALMVKLSESQIELKPVLLQLAESSAGKRAVATNSLDESTRAHIRNLDIYMARLLEELNTGRDEIIQQIRSEIKLLARTLAAIAEKSKS